MIIDKQGRLGGKISVIDAALALIIAGLLTGFFVRQFSIKETVQATNATFYVTVSIEPVRDFSVAAITEGDVFYEQFATQSMGKAISIIREPAREVIKLPDGTAYYVEMEEKYRLLVTLECSGIIRDTGYFINGNSQMAEGSDIRLQSNKVACYARVEKISETL